MAGVYIHIPFCRQICHYCDFHRSGSLARKDEMLAQIASELSERQAEIKHGSARTLYFGGGTPSLCSPEEIGTLVERVRSLWGVSDFEEVTLEANPDDLTPEYLGELRSVSVDRLSIGIQSFHNEHLLKMNRRHTGDEAVRAVRETQKAGFDNLTIDLIYGLPWMTRDEWIENLNRAVDLGVQHVSAYHLTIEDRTVFGKRGLKPVEDSESQWQFDRLREVLSGAGFEHYEISNFAKPGFRARHNSSYWSGEAYLGVGPSAHSYDGQDRRSWNVSRNDLYLEGVPPEVEVLTPKELLNEYLMTRLRTSDGVDIDDFNGRFSADDTLVVRQAVGKYLASGEMVRTGNRIAIKPEYFLISDYLIGSLFV